MAKIPKPAKTGEPFRGVRCDNCKLEFEAYIRQGCAGFLRRLPCKPFPAEGRCRQSLTGKVAAGGKVWIAMLTNINIELDDGMVQRFLLSANMTDPFPEGTPVRVDILGLKCSKPYNNEDDMKPLRTDLQNQSLRHDLEEMRKRW